MSRPVEIASNAVAMQLESSYGPDLRMTEQPKGWLQFFEPESESEVVK